LGVWSALGGHRRLVNPRDDGFLKGIAGRLNRLKATLIETRQLQHSGESAGRELKQFQAAGDFRQPQREFLPPPLQGLGSGEAFRSHQRIVPVYMVSCRPVRALHR
jgi:hypothetical protein